MVVLDYISDLDKLVMKTGTSLCFAPGGGLAIGLLLKCCSDSLLISQSLGFLYLFDNELSLFLTN